MFNQRLISY